MLGIFVSYKLNVSHYHDATVKKAITIFENINMLWKIYILPISLCKMTLGGICAQKPQTYINIIYSFKKQTNLVLCKVPLPSRKKEYFFLGTFALLEMPYQFPIEIQNHFLLTQKENKLSRLKTVPLITAWWNTSVCLTDSSLTVHI